MAEDPPGTQIRSVGDGALLVELGEPTPATTALARTLAARIRAAQWSGLYDVVPAYRTVLLRYNPEHCDPAFLRRAVEPLLHDPGDATADSGREVTLPVCYGGEYGPDLADVAQHTGFTPEEIVRLHAGAAYRVEFLGFSPGFPYL